MIARPRPATRRWHRYMRFSVRALILGVLVVGGWLGWIVRSARIQREAVAAIERDGGLVTYESRHMTTPRHRYGKPYSTNWLVNAIGVDYFERVVEVWIPSSATHADEDSIQVGRLPALVELSIDSPNLTDAGMAQLSGLTNLTYLSLADSQITDSGLVHLKGLTELLILCLRGTRVTDAGLMHLKGLTNLARLDLGSARVSDSGLANVRGLTNLWALNLDGTRITDGAFAHLKRLTELRHLYIKNTRVTDGGRKRLERAMVGLQIRR